jgi:hypothetical protein
LPHVARSPGHHGRRQMEVGQDLAHDGTRRDRRDDLAPAATNGALFDGEKSMSKALTIFSVISPLPLTFS